MVTPLRVVIVDDEALMRRGLRLLVDGVAGITVVGEAADGREALSVIGSLDPDVVLLDIRMPVLDGIETLRELAARGSRAHVVVLTAFDTDAFLQDALRAGAVSFLLKDSQPELVIEAVLAARSGEPQFSPSALRRLVTLAAKDEPAPRTHVPAEAPEGVTQREWEVGRLVVAGLSNQEIAAELFVSLATVKTHLGHLFDKYHATNRVQLAMCLIHERPPP